MKSFISILLFLTFCNLNFLYSQVNKNELQITYIANEGFLLKSATKKVLIDALFTEGYGYFAVPSKEITNDILNDKAPFDNVSSYFLTHYHADHCSPLLINEYLSKHMNMPFIASKPSIVFINGTCFDFILLKKQFYELTPEVNQSVFKTINNVPVKAFGLKHMSYYRDSIDMEENMFNVSLLFEMDGIKIFHSGDIKINALKDYLTKNKQWADSIDVAFLYYEFFESGASDLDFIINNLHPKFIVMMHVPPSQSEEYMVKVEQLKAKFPNMIILKNSMDSKTINIAVIAK